MDRTVKFLGIASAVLLVVLVVVGCPADTENNPDPPQGSCVPEDCVSQKCKADKSGCEAATPACEPDKCATQKCLSNGKCAEACTGTCDGGLTCCGSVCAEINKDPENCGACGVSCSDSEFCTSTECTNVTFANIKSNSRAVVVLDGLKYDDEAANSLKDGLGYDAQTIRVLNQFVPGIMNSAGRPVVGPGETIFIVGGSYKQEIVKYLNNKGVTLLESKSEADGSAHWFEERATGKQIGPKSSASLEESGKKNDVFCIQLVVEPISGSLVVISQGVFGTGTKAAALYLSGVIMKDLPKYTERWYVFSWKDTNNDGQPSLDEITPEHGS